MSQVQNVSTSLHTYLCPLPDSLHSLTFYHRPGQHLDFIIFQTKILSFFKLKHGLKVKKKKNSLEDLEDLRAVKNTCVETIQDEPILEWIRYLSIESNIFASDPISLN